MFNPLVDSFENLTDTQVDQAVNELSRKYFLTRNPQLQMQIATILEMYKEEMRARNAKSMQKLHHNQENGEDGLDNLININ